MRVTKLGRRNIWWDGGEIECGMCGSVMVLEENDRSNMKHHEGEGVLDPPYWSVTCPVCEGSIAFTEGEIRKQRNGDDD